MNIVSTMVGITIAGVAAPSVMQMSLAPVEAQVRARNFSQAESAAVTFSSKFEGQTDAEWVVDSSLIPENCDVPVEVSSRAYDITCYGGEEESKYRQTVTRSYRLKPEDTGGYTNPTRSFAFDTPAQFSHVECQTSDPWGVMWYNEHLAAGHLNACQPSILRSREAYLESNPDDWLFDISDFGYGRHPDF